MKKIAVCISGHLRQPLQGYEKFNEMVIIPNSHNCEFDFFIETWDTDDWRKGKFPTQDISSLTTETIEGVLQLYRPMLTRIQKNIVFDTSRYQHHIRPGDVKKNSRGEHIPAMYYKILKSNELKLSYETDFGFEYDLVIRHRSDFALTHPLILNDDIFKKIKDTIFVANHKNATPTWYSDVFAFSSSQNMNYYSSLINHLDFLVEKYQIFRPEPLLYFHLNEDVPFSVDILDYDWKILY